MWICYYLLFSRKTGYMRKKIFFILAIEAVSVSFVTKNELTPKYLALKS